MEAKKIKELVISIFIAVIFIASYAAFGNGNGSTSTTTASTTINQNLYYATGTVNAIVYGYGPTMIVSTACSSASVRNAAYYNASALLTKLQDNNSISNYFSPNGTSFVVYTQKLDSYRVSSYLGAMEPTNASKDCLYFSGDVFAALPESVTLLVSTQSLKVPIPAGLKNYSVDTQILSQGSSISLKIATFLNVNGIISGNMSITPVVR
ncbi:MAG: hypothetical protein KGH61_03580 [Candidatus Micrarchaeota archaeon]|nr:hypothetical protein [Candidatus Micrarchaeota archaeon]MDE1848004.1 hypothetical protein [Candidatus Micrarchaeota archaeon]MDE1864708.1 hypothetical protein [Candidatus Micrarchaeota archaeon]